MAELGYFQANLPSRGVLYDGRVPNGTVEIRKLTGGELAILNQQNLPVLDRLSAVLTRCVRIPNAFPHADLLLTDRMALLFSLRQLSFDAIYTFRFRCLACEQMSPGRIDVGEDLAVRVATDELKEPIVCHLPDSGKTLSLRFLRGTDEERIAKRAKRVNLQSNDQEDASFFHRVALQITGVDGEEPKLEEREAFVRDMTARDIQTAVKALDAVEPGLDLKVMLVCRRCGAENQTILPFTTDFFRAADG